LAHLFNFLIYTKYKDSIFELIPIPNISTKEQKLIINLVDEILKKKKEGQDTTLCERKIDLLVYKLYNLYYEEVLIVDPDFTLSKEEYVTFN
jgi:adenine-specific DNA-methyltransferase